MIPSTSTSIPKCGVYLSPMRTSQVFCVDKPVSVKDLTTQQSVSLFEEESCTPLCELVPHVSFEAILFEAGGSGWMGGYYAITPLIHFTKSRVAMYQGRAVRNISAVSAGTLEWSFFDTSRICLPLGDFYRSIRRTQSVSPEGPTRYQKENKDSEWEEEEEEEDQDEEGERGREALESQAVSLTAPACYIMHLSVPDVTPMVSPLMQLAKSWTLPLAKGKTPKTGAQYCLTCASRTRILTRILDLESTHSLDVTVRWHDSHVTLFITVPQPTHIHTNCTPVCVL